MGRAHLPVRRPEAQAEEGYGPSSAGWPWDSAEDSSVLSRPKVPPERGVKTV